MKQGAHLKPTEITFESSASIRQWLADTWENDGDGWILGHAYSGLLCGKAVNKEIVLSFDADPAWGADLDPETLLDLRVFNKDKELRLWRKGMDIAVCIVREEKSAEKNYLSFDEKQIFMVGERKGSPLPKNGISFSLLTGPGGRQALPVDWDGSNKKYRLHVRHYLKQDVNTGMLRIYESRLLDISDK